LGFQLLLIALRCAVLRGVVHQKRISKMDDASVCQRRDATHPGKPVPLKRPWSGRPNSTPARPSSKAEIARSENLTRARVTQVMALLRLAPEIHDHILSMPWWSDGRR
jgi:hypothetical protein